MANLTARSKTLKAAGVAAVLLLAFAAGGVWRRAHRHLEADRRLRHRAGEWHRQITTELPADDAAAWEAAGSQQPVELLRGCANERVDRPGATP